MQLENYFNLIFLGILPFIIFLLFRFQKWKKNKREVFAENKFHPQIFEKPKFFSKIFPFLYLLASSFLVLALMNWVSQSREEIQINQKNSNILFLVDVSNSMNSNDIEPSRLEQSKEILSQSLSALDTERVGIVVFAGEAKSLMPLTTDYSSAKLFLNNINSELISRQGTDFLLAVKESSKKLKNVQNGTKKIILISDGEDNEGHHDAAIREAIDHNISITTVGIGTEEGSYIPEQLLGYYSDFKRDELGQIIISKRETSALKSIAQSTGGKYINGNSVSSAVTEIIKDIKSSGQENSQDNSITTLHTKYYYQYFLGIAIFLFLFIYLLNPKRDFNY